VLNHVLYVVMAQHQQYRIHAAGREQDLKNEEI
jgi:hypothetical protein